MQRSPVGLARYGSAPGSLLASIADSVIGGGGGGGGSGGGYGGVGSEGVMMSRFYPGDASSITAESSGTDLELFRRNDGSTTAAAAGTVGMGGRGMQQRAYAAAEMAIEEITAEGETESEAEGRKPPGGGGGVGGPHAVMRHSSSPAGFFDNLMRENGFSASRGHGNYLQPRFDSLDSLEARRLETQLSFSRHDSLSQISEISIPDVAENIGNGNNPDEVAGPSYISNNFQVSLWDDTNCIAFSAPPRKQAKDNNGDIIGNFDNFDSQFSLPAGSVEMASVEKFLKMHQDTVPFKIRAKRGCATHPRSIAERERRTRISEKLRKLQELVPNMDKQTNTADMLDLAVQHIKRLQGQVQKLNEERANCTCDANKR